VPPLWRVRGVLGHCGDTAGTLCGWSYGHDPGTITATQVTDGGRWFAHSSTVVGYGMILLLLGAGTVAWGGYRMREAGRRGR